MSGYREALAWLYGLSDTERTGAFVREREENLRRERALLAHLGEPQRAYGISHVAGTKGKGSTAALLASILRAADVRTGLYTSPDLHTFRERIQVDGVPVAEETVARLLPQVRAAVEAMDPALGAYITWEAATALAFLAFRDAEVEHAVIEVGLGGRLDATNVVEPWVTAITSISYDHWQVLGETLPEIAAEKAGILKPGVPAITAAQGEDVLAVLQRVARERGAPLVRIGPEGTPGCAYTYRPQRATATLQTFDLTTPTGTYTDLELTLLGEHQLANAATAIAAAEVLRARGLPLDGRAIRDGLRTVRWPARMQVVGRAPWVVVDTAHNADSMERLLAGLRRHFRFARLHVLFSAMADKDIPGMARALAAADPARVVVCRFSSPRATTAEEIAARMAVAAPSLPLTVVEALPDALTEALAGTSKADLLCIAGSVAFAGEALRTLAARPAFAASGIEIAGVDH